MKKRLLLLSMIVLASCSSDDQETTTPQTKTIEYQGEMTAAEFSKINVVSQHESNPTGRYISPTVVGDFDFQINDGLVSPNGNYIMLLSNEGFLRIANRSRGLVGTFASYQGAWTSGQSAIGTVARFQTDGNFVIYFKNRAVWHSGTYGNYGAYMIMQDDGNLVIYRKGTNQAIWSSRYNTLPGGFWI